MPANAPQVGCWSLEIVRGTAVGRQYALETGETVVGNALNGARGLDLVDQEGNSPRKMAGRHAALSDSGQELTIRDLETPGGTFVNQQRLLAGQTRRLVPGDVIQLGSVQVRVKHVLAPAGAPAGKPAAPAPKLVAPASTPVPKPAVPVLAPERKPVASSSAPAPSAKARRPWLLRSKKR